MPVSRRANNNTYCKSTRTLLDRAGSLNGNESNTSIAVHVDEYYDRDTGRYEGGRYHKLNLCAYLRHGTIEFRHHAGTVNPVKIVNWIAFCLNFVETSISSDSANIFEGLNPDTVEFFNTRAAALTV
jgi:hypothetical protein